MINGTDGELTPTPRVLAFLSATGSFASIIALSIVLIQQASQQKGVPAEGMVWRVIFALISLVATGASCVDAYLYCRVVQLGQMAPLAKVLRICLVIMIALLAVGVGVDGFLSSFLDRLVANPRPPLLVDDQGRYLSAISGVMPSICLL